MDGDTLTIAGKRFEHIKTRERVSIGVFRSEDKTQFLRIGNKKSIAQEIALHKNLIQYGFPVPSIIAEGEYGQEAYYIEQSLGEKHFGDLFLQDYKRTGKVSDVCFDSLMALSKSFAEAQIKTAQDKNDRL